MTVVPSGLADYVREIKYLLGTQTVCAMGYGYPKESTHNCRRQATIRMRMGESDRFDWHYHCDYHSKWPTEDRSRWLERDVQKLVDGEWVDWTDFTIHTPNEHRYVPEGYDTRGEYLRDTNDLSAGT